MRDDARFTASGRLRVVARKTGQVLVDDVAENLVLAGSAEIVCRSLAGAVDAAIAYIGIGNGTEPVDVDQTGLSGDGFNAQVTQVSYPTANEAMFTATVSEQEANDLLTVSEFVLFSGDFRAFSRRVRDLPIPKTNEITLTIEWTLTITSVDAGA